MFNILMKSTYRNVTLSLIVTLVVISGCNHSPSSTRSIELLENEPLKNEQELLLNGQWKFKTFLGEGSSYRDISPSSTDVIIDNSDHELVETFGHWKTQTVGARDSKFWGDDFLALNYRKLDPAIKVNFNYPKISSGYYEHFVYYPFVSSLNTKITVKHADGETSKYFNQRNRPGQWLSLGVFNIVDPKKSKIEFSTVHKGQVAVDAVMLRPVDKQAYIQAKSHKEQAYTVDLPDENWGRLKVPGHWGMINEYSTYTGKGWYRKHFTAPQTWRAEPDQRYRLAFDGVYHVANVYLNGEFLGTHKGGFTPFEFDVTDKLNFSKKNVIAVEADNSAIVGATWNWGGIIRDVKLIKNNDVRITFQHIHAEPNLEKGDAELTLKVRVENLANKARELRFTAQVNKGDNLTDFEHQFDVAANTVSEFELKGKLPAEQVELWHFDRPNLYHLTSNISEQGKALHQVKERFGIRKIEITDSQFLLNGEPVRIGGYNRISDHRYWGTSEPDELLANDIALMKNSGANFMRIMHGTQNKKLIELCDEAGILIFEEANIRELTNPEFVAPDYTLNKQWIKEMIERDINHPSIIGWSIGNELKEHYQYVDSVITYVKTELDSTRLVTNVSNTGYRPIDSAENDPLGLSDLMMQNIYQKDPESVISTIEERWPNRPLFISEYGLGRFDTASLDNDYPSFSSWHEMIRGRNTHVVGTSVWSFNDYRSGYAQSLEEENRAWGVVNTWRQKRRAYSTFQQELSPIKSLTLENVNLSKKSAQVAISVRSLQDYPSYTMKDYQLEWELKAKDGEILATNSLAMPTLTPNDPTWKSAIDWSGEFANIYSLTVRVMSSNGYTRFEMTKDLLKPLVPQINNVLTSDNAIHVEFEKQNNEVEHFIRYTSSNGKVIESAKTISNYIRLTGIIKGLSSGDNYTLALIASNNLGDSKPSTPVNVTLAGKPLAPIIYKVMVDEDNLIVGFSGLADDRHYILKYGYDEKTLNMMETSSGRGMITAKINSGTTKVYFQLKRVGLSSESQWTNIRSINVH